MAKTKNKPSYVLFSLLFAIAIYQVLLNSITDIAIDLEVHESLLWLFVLVLNLAIGIFFFSGGANFFELKKGNLAIFSGVLYW